MSLRGPRATFRIRRPYSSNHEVRVVEIGEAEVGEGDAALTGDGDDHIRSHLGNDVGRIEIVAVCGNRSDISIPDEPRGANFQGQPSTFELASAALSYLISPGNFWPSNLFSSGFGSNKSMWLGPPCMNSEIIAVARGLK